MNEIKLYTGMAGSGKSHMLRELVAAKPEGTLVVAPTGVSALLVGGQTIHRAFRLPTHLIGEGDIRMNMRDYVLYNGVERIIVDEWGMVRADLLNAANWVLQKNRRCGLPFGGVQVTMFGDPFQLPPILSAKDEPTFYQMGYTSKWLFSLPFIKEANVTVLTKNYRQDDKEFIKALSEIRLGEPSRETLDLINSRVGVELESPYITLTPKNIEVETVNMERYMLIKGEERVYAGEMKDKFDEKDCVSPIHLCLKVGVQVMMTKNDLSGRWVNGTMAVVSRLGKDSVWVLIKGNEHEVEPVTWEKMESNYDSKTRKTSPVPIGSFTQLPMKLAYAITIHKSQGQTLSKGKVELNGTINTEGQAYVMLSRFTSLEAFSLSRPLTANDVRVNKEVREWYERVAT